MNENKTVVFDVGGTNCRIALFENGQITWRDQLATPAMAGPNATIDIMAQLFAPLGNLQAPIVVAVTGQVVDGCVTAHNQAILSNWDSFPLQQRLSDRLQQPVQLINDARAAAWGEYLYGSGQGMNEFMFLTVSTGIGAGLILGGRLHLAKNGFDAEIGETRCADGRTLEQHACGTALGALALQYRYANARLLCDAAERGDAQANTLYQNGIREIAAKIADLAVLLGIQRVAVGGSVGLRARYLERLSTELAKYPAIYRVELVQAQLGHDAGLFGAANMVEVT